VATQATTEIFSGTVRRVSGEVSRTDRTALVEGELQETAGLLKPGMYAEVRVRLRALEGALLVPDVALLERVSMAGEQATGVMLVEGDAAAAGEPGEPAAAARWTSVEVLGRSSGLAAIEGRVAEGDLVLTLGHSELQDGAPIRVVLEQSGEPAPPPAEATGAAP
jgi:multidrug efflux pump subunit AcrA (membrane-fusion protein)